MMTLDLSPEAAALVVTIAAEAGKTPELWLRDTLTEAVRNLPTREGDGKLVTKSGKQARSASKSTKTKKAKKTDRKKK